MTWSLEYLGVNANDIRRLAKVALSYAPFSIGPEQIQIDITDRCNYRCPTCTKWLHKSKEHELTTEQWKDFLTRSAKLPFSGRIVFAGGEPLLRPDLTELIQHATDLHLDTVVISNGSLLKESRLRALQDAGLNYLMVSLNALDASMHDSTRGVDGSFDRLMRMIETYSGLRETMNMGIASIIMERNIDQILPLVDFVEKHALHGIIFQAYMDDAVHHPFRGNHAKFRDDNFFENDADVVLDHDRLDSLVDTLLPRQRKGARILNAPSQLRAMKDFYRNPVDYRAVRCTAGVSNFLADAYGDVRLCFGFEPIGNILQEEPLNIWKSTKAADLRRRIAKCQRSCRIMNHIY